jgi:hypothetical protein
MNFLVKETTNETLWDTFIYNSLNKNFYSLSKVINLEINHKKFFVYKNKEIVASFCLVFDKSKNIISPKYALYTPINYKLMKNSSLSSIYSNQLSVNEAVKKFILSNFKKINLTLDTCTNDIRPFSWFGYPEYKKKFNFDILYTYICKIDNLTKKNIFKKEIYLNSSETNRRDIRNALEKNYQCKEIFSKDIFFKLKESSYKLHKQKLNRSFYEKQFEAIKFLEKKGMIKMYVCFNDDKPVAMNLFSIINSKSMFLHSGRADGNSKNLYGVFLLLNSIFSLSRLGINTLDMEGINSPKNSFSKLKYGGKILPYYQLRYK